MRVKIQKYAKTFFQNFILGWLFKVELSNEGEVKNLMSEKQYEEYLKTQEAH